MSASNMMLAVIFGAIGMGFAMYGKKTQNYFFLLVGIVEMVYPYASPNPWVTLIIGIILTAMPFIIKL